MKYILYAALTLVLHLPFEGFALLPFIPPGEAGVVIHEPE